MVMMMVKTDPLVLCVPKYSLRMRVEGRLKIDDARKGKVEFGTLVDGDRKPGDITTACF